MNDINKYVNVPQGNNPSVNIKTQNVYLKPQPKDPIKLEIRHNLPRSNVTIFVGRDEALKQLDEQLQTKERVAICAVAGMGGIGKTELALQYAIADRQKPKDQQYYSGGICWVNAAKGNDAGIEIVDFARTYLPFNIPVEGELKDRVRYCWLNWPEGEVLVIFDDVANYEQLIDALPPQEPRFKVIVTTRNTYLTTSLDPLRLPVLDKEPALKLLGSYIGETRLNEQQEDGKNLCKWLGYLPLGLELVGRFLKRKPTWSLAKMLEKLKERSLDDRSLYEPSPEMTAKRGVAAAFDLSWNELDESAQNLGCFLSLFGLSPFPWEWVKQAFSDIDEEELEDSRDDYLITLNLIEDKGEETYQLHPLIREFFRSKLKLSAAADNQKQCYCETLIPLAKIDQTLTITDIETLKPIIPHLMVIAEEFYGYLAEDDLIWGFVGLGSYYKNQGLYENAVYWMEQCLGVTQKLLGTEHPSVATSLNNLAALYESQGRYEEAKPLYLQALSMRQKLLGTEHPDVATSLDNLAGLYRSQGRYEEAEPLYLQALSMRQKLLGTEHPAVAESLNNLAELYRSQGRDEEAEPLHLQALSMRQKLLGTEHPDVASSINNLAALYYSQGRYEEAEPLYLQALSMIQKLLGTEHPYVASSINNLAALYRSQGRYEEAEPLYLQALSMIQKLLGTEHPDVATSLNNLAGLYYSQGRYEEAEPLYLQALSMRQKLLGTEHPDVASSLNNLAGLYESQGRYEEAEPVYLQALSIAEKILGENHPNTNTIRRNYELLIMNYK